MDEGLMTHLHLDFCGMQVYMNNSCDADCTAVSHNASNVNDVPNL